MNNTTPKKEKLYIITSRYGVDMDPAVCSRTKRQANAYIKQMLAETVREESAHIDNSRINIDNDDAVIRWAKKYDLIKDTTFIGSDTYTEYRITEVMVESGKDIFIITSRRGCDLNNPTICYSEKEARQAISTAIAELIRDDMDDSEIKALEAEGKSFEIEEDILEYGYDNDLCASYNVDDLYDTYKDPSDDWVEHRIDRAEYIEKE